MIYLRNYAIQFLIFLLLVSCTPRDGSLVYRPESLEPPVERPIEIESECEGEDCPPPNDDSTVDEILVDNFDPYGSGEAGTPTSESPTQGGLTEESSDLNEVNESTPNLESELEDGSEPGAESNEG